MFATLRTIGTVLSVGATLAKLYFVEMDRKKRAENKARRKDFAEALAKKDTDTISRMLDDVLRG